ncbi:TIGR02680 family protein [Kutzneria albida]|uniref:TIGR02680 family protein n=1 Tax=Kutzneria albida DSM 43870 TaxID=1449976 RepID=W5WBZ7_9PSEU|nr:TIGR02680 family protein [Kutzneria albida]AHH98673.1 hypothetical protein KALB_5311 [Kutzneria albida DSM 43870]
MNAALGALPMTEPAALRNPSRYRLNRAGVCNVWQYSDQEFRFGDGRLLLRGKNGAGKSKALEVLLPYLLDGDARRIDATGSTKTSLSWLMLDGIDPINRIGYLWLEFEQVDETGQLRWLTLGAAIKASKSTGEARPTFFVTPLRVAHDLTLVSAGQPLPVDVLRELVGAGNCFERPSEYRLRVMRDLFGLTEPARYRNLLHLLYRLRRPTIGDRIESGELQAVLAEALPPLDDEVITRVAHNFDDLAAVRAELSRLESVDEVLTEFLKHYRGYLHGVLRTRCEAVRSELASLADRRKDAGRAEQRVVRSTADEHRHVARHTELVDQRDQATAELTALRDSHAYRGLEQLRDRRSAVAAIAESVAAAWELVRLAHRSERSAAERVTVALNQLGTRVTRLKATQRVHQQQVTSCGLPAAVLGTAPELRTSSLAAAVEWAATDPTGRTETLRSDSVITADSATESLLGTWHTELTEGRRSCASRLRLAEDLDRLLAAMAAAESAADQARTERERLDAEVEQADAAASSALEATAVTSRDYQCTVLEWATHPLRLGADLSNLLAVVAVSTDQSLPAGDRVLDADTPAEVALLAQRALEPIQQHLEHARDDALVDEARVRAEFSAVQEELLSWQEHRDPEPPASPYRAGARLPGTGAPFYLLVDFRDDLPAGQRAGLEAALESSGLLAAWVTAGGHVLAPDTHETVLEPGVAVDGPNMGDVLHVVDAGSSGVSPAQVERILHGVELVPAGGRPRTANWLSTDGRWQLGVLRGAYTKRSVEFVGAAARAAARARRIAELESRRAELDSALLEHAQRRAVLELDCGLLRTAARTVPVGRELASAWTALEQRRSLLRAVISELSSARVVADRATQKANRARGAAGAAASADRFPVDRERLRAVRDQLARIRDGLDSFCQEVDQTSRDAGELPAVVEDWRCEATASEEARRGYTERHTMLVSAQLQLSTLEEAIGTAESDLLAIEHRAEDRYQQAVRQLPAVAQHRQVAHDDLIRARADREVALRLLRDQENVVIGAGGLLRTPLGDNALLLAADLSEITPAVDAYDSAAEADARDRLIALRALADATSGSLRGQSADVGDTGILRRHETVRDRLAGGYDIEVSEELGIKRFELRDDAGRHDIALVQQRIHDEAERARTRLTTREQETFERFLLGELGDHLARQILAAEALTKQMTETLKDVHTSHGLGASLKWQLQAGASANIREAAELLRGPAAMRTREQTARLRDILQEEIERHRQETPNEDYKAHLTRALDYRSWFEFDIRVTDAAKPGPGRKLNQRTAMSQGEQRVVSYLVLFATAAAHFGSLAKVAPNAPRLILLDDAFAKVDEPTHGRLLGLLVALDLDFVLTSERLWGCFPSVPSLHIYECLRDTQVRGVATLHFTWDGSNKRLVSL